MGCLLLPQLNKNLEIIQIFDPITKLKYEIMVNKNQVDKTHVTKSLVLYFFLAGTDPCDSTDPCARADQNPHPLNTSYTPVLLTTFFWFLKFVDVWG